MLDRSCDILILGGGGLINNQELAWTLVTQAPERIIEIENRFGCYFDRNAADTIHQRALRGAANVSQIIPRWRGQAVQNAAFSPLVPRPLLP